jgi:hypothetical protein
MEHDGKRPARQGGPAAAPPRRPARRHRRGVDVAGAATGAFWNTIQQEYSYSEDNLHTLRAHLDSHLVDVMFRPWGLLPIVYARTGMLISRAAFCDWIRQVIDLLEPIIKRIRRDVLASFGITTEDTVVRLVVPANSHTVQAACGAIWATLGTTKCSTSLPRTASSSIPRGSSIGRKLGMSVKEKSFGDYCPSCAGAKNK